MFISACHENENRRQSLVAHQEPFIEATKIEHNEDQEFFEWYKNFLKITEDNFNTVEIDESLFGNRKNKFLNLTERLVRNMKEEEDDYLLCSELECPVCLVEMVPPTKIWTCKYGHTLCQSCKRNPNIGKIKHQNKNTAFFIA